MRTSDKVYVYGVPEERQLDRLQLKVSDVRDRVLENVKNDTDIEVFEYLLNNHIIPTILTSHEMRNNPYYEIEDKLIQLEETNSDSRTYSVPYPGGGRFDSGKIFVHDITIYDDGRVQFGSGKIRDLHDYSVSTLKRDFFNS